MLCFSQMFHRLHSLDPTEMRGRCRGFIFCCKNFRHTHTMSFTQSISALQAGQLSHISQIFMFGEAELGGKINQCFFYDSLMRITVSRIWHRTVSMKAETTKSILKRCNRWEPQNFNIGFLQISLRVDSFLKAVRDREREKGSNRETVYRVVIGKNITVD